MTTAELPAALESVCACKETGASFPFSLPWGASAGSANDPIDSISVLFSLASSAVTNSCYVQYSNTNQAYYLLNDAGDSWIYLTPGGPNNWPTASNSQCTVQASNAATVSGLSVSATVLVTAANGFQGPKNVYLNAVSASGLASSSQLMGTWLASSSPGATIIADSVCDFSLTQNSPHNWSYGYFVGSDASHTFHPLSSQSGYPNWTHVDQSGNNVWGSPNQWTGIAQGYAHPNGPNSPGGAEFAVQRWTSTQTANLQITVRLAKFDTGGGDGTEAILFQNGTEKARVQVASNDSIGKIAVVTLSVNVGDTLDLALGSLDTDNNDGSTLSMTIVPADSPTVYTDSLANFSTTTGQAWSYGTYAAGTQTFSQNLNYQPSFGSWTHTTTRPPWTTISADAAHPNKGNAEAEEVAVRRWTSTVAGYAQIGVHVAKGDNSCGDGTQPAVYQNGLLLGNWQLAYNDTLGYTANLLTYLRIGDAVDFALAAGGNDSCDVTIFTAHITPGPSEGTVFSDSVLQFSGVQGANGWEYGYVTPTVGSNGGYQQLAYYDPVLAQWSHNGQFPPNSPWWTTLTPTSTVPNVGPVEDTVRRWTSNVTGPVRVNWHMAKSQTGCGDGTWGYLYVNGTRQQVLHVAAADTVGFASTFNTNLRIRDQVDFRVAAGPDPETNSDSGCDGTEIRATVVARDPGGAVLVSSSGLEQKVQVPFGDLPGVLPIAVARIKFTGSDGTLKCEVDYTVSTNSFAVAAGTGCTVQMTGSGSSATGADSTLLVTFDVTFTTADTRALLSRAVERSDNSSTDWVAMGVWPIGGVPSCGPGPTREYVRLGGRLVAIENRVCTQ